VADGKNIDIHAETGAQSAFVTGDQNRLQQLLINLLSNAIKFTPQHGSVQIALRIAGERIEVQVKDTGIGFRSRWITPLSCTASSASAICFAIGRASSIGIGPRSILSASVSPGTSSITRNFLPLAFSSP
jgi:phosphoglycerate-specific signal transduction histidine kinase